MAEGRGQALSSTPIGDYLYRRQRQGVVSFRHDPWEQQERFRDLHCRMAGRSMKRRHHPPLNFAAGASPQRPPEKQFALKHAPDSDPGTTCVKTNLRRAAHHPPNTMTHPDDWCHHLPGNRHVKVPDSIRDRCYPKNLKKRFLITHLRSLCVPTGRSIRIMAPNSGQNSPPEYGHGQRRLAPATAVRQILPLASRHHLPGETLSPLP